MATILVAEDLTANRTLIAMQLRAAGHEVVEAVDGQEAVDKAKVQTPDLVILDMMMPRLDGYGACEQLRQLPGMAGVPIMALTALEEEFGMAQLRAAGFDHLMWKPWEPTALTSTVNGLLAKGR